MDTAVAVIGAPAVGKTTLTTLLGARPGCAVFRLREHVPEALLAATATSAERLGWIDDVTVARVVRRFIETVGADPAIRTVLMDNFPGSATQAALLVSTVRKLVPACVVCVAELVVADPEALKRRIRSRRVCHQCERDPIHDPRLSAEASLADPRRCARCGSVLHPRRGDAPRLVAARTRRYQDAVTGIRQAFAEGGIAVWRLDTSLPAEELSDELSKLLTTRSTAL